MQMLVLGIGDAFTSRYFGSSALVRGPGGELLIDCPALLNRALREACEASGWCADVLDVDDIVLTHLHGDHCNGLEAFGFQRRLARMRDPAATRPRVHTIEPVARRMWERLAPAMEPPMGDGHASTLEDYFDVRVIEPQRPATICGLTVECRITRHPIPTIGLRIGDGDVTLGWSGDTAFDPQHIAWLADADLIVHEANVGEAVHTPLEKLNALPADLRARMRLNHLTDDFDETATDIAPLREGEVVSITAGAERSADERTKVRK